MEPGCEKGGSPSDSSVGSAGPRGYTGIYRHILIYTGSTGCIYRIELYRDEKDKQFRWVGWTLDKEVILAYTDVYIGGGGYIQYIQVT